MNERIKQHEHIKRAACHEMGHACAREILPSLNGVEFVALTFSSHDGALVGNVRLNPDTSKSELLFENVVAKLAGIAAEVLLAGADKAEALLNAKDDRAEVHKLIAHLDEPDRVYFCSTGMTAAYQFVEENRLTILRLADELIANQYIGGDRVRELVAERRTENGKETRTESHHSRAVVEE